MSLSARFGWNQKGKSVRKIRRRPGRFRPRLDVLEERWMPSLFTVNSVVPPEILA